MEDQILTILQTSPAVEVLVPNLVKGNPILKDPALTTVEVSPEVEHLILSTVEVSP